MPRDQEANHLSRRAIPLRTRGVGFEPDPFMTTSRPHTFATFTLRHAFHLDTFPFFISFLHIPIHPIDLRGIFLFFSFSAHRYPCSLHPRTHALRSAPHVLNRRTYWPCFFRCISLVDLWVLFLLLSYPFVTAGVGDAIFLKVNVSMPSIMISMTWRNSFR